MDLLEFKVIDFPELSDYLLDDVKCGSCGGLFCGGAGGISTPDDDDDQDTNNDD
jgi:hypothetical protein